MEKFRQLPPWQIISLAAGILLLFLVGGYFLVTVLTSVKPVEEAQSQIPADLNSETNQETVKKLEAFEPPNNLPILTNPVRTPDPNAPSTVNPFER